MRLHRHVTLASLTLAAAAGAVAGAWSARWDGEASSPLPGIAYETTVEVVSPREPEGALRAEVRAARRTHALGEPVVLEAVVTNDGDQPLTTPASGALDLLVRREGAQAALLSIVDAGTPVAMAVGPWASAMREIVLGADAPFDRPGRYVVSGTWHREGEPDVVVGPLELTIVPAPAVAARPVDRADA